MPVLLAGAPCLAHSPRSPHASQRTAAHGRGSRHRTLWRAHRCSATDPATTACVVRLSQPTQARIKVARAHRQPSASTAPKTRHAARNDESSLSCRRASLPHLSVQKDSHGTPLMHARCSHDSFPGRPPVSCLVLHMYTGSRCACSAGAAASSLLTPSGARDRIENSGVGGESIRGSRIHYCLRRATQS